MSKVYLEQVQKAQMLVDGLRKNYELIKGFGVSQEQLELLEKDAETAAGYNKELDTLRAEVSQKASVANKKLAEVKTSIMELKQIVKRNFPQEQWQLFGITDKR